MNHLYPSDIESLIFQERKRPLRIATHFWRKNSRFLGGWSQRHLAPHEIKKSWRVGSCVSPSFHSHHWLILTDGSFTAIPEIRMPKKTSHRRLLPETTIRRVSPRCSQLHNKSPLQTNFPRTKQNKLLRFKKSHVTTYSSSQKKRGTQNPSRFLVGGFKPSEKYQSKWVHLPQIGWTCKKELSCHHLVLLFQAKTNSYLPAVR